MNAAPASTECPRVATLSDAAQVTLIRDNQISGALAALIHSARTSVLIVQYHFRPRKSPRTEMLDVLTALIDAADRNLAIRVLLNHQIAPRRWTPRHGTLYDRLKHPNIKIRHHDTAEILHSKLVVFDDRAVILGSHNYSEASFRTTKNVSVLIDSPSFARRLLLAYNPIWERATNAAR